MANRTPSGLPPTDLPSVLGWLTGQLGDLRAEVRVLQSNAGLALPDDFRFAVSDDGARVEIVRVSTGEVVTLSTAVAPPVVSVDGETGAVELPGYTGAADPATPALRTLGDGPGQAAAGDDPRFDAIDSDLTKIAGANLSADRVVRSQPDGTVVYATNTDPADASTALWLTRTAASVGDTVTVTAFGEVTELTWTWDPTMPIFLGAAGVLTQTPPTAPAFLLQVASCVIEPTRIRFAPQLPVLLA